MLESAQKFKRWDRVKFKWRKPTDDQRQESRRIDQQSLVIVGDLKKSERAKYLSKSIVTSLNREYEAGRSFALLKAEISEFIIEKKNLNELQEEILEFKKIQSQSDLFIKNVVPYNPCPYKFKYRYKTDDGPREGTCQDWELDATYFKWSREYGEKNTLDKMGDKFGVEYPREGMLLAMGTHSRWADKWLINGVVRMPDIPQLALF